MAELFCFVLERAFTGRMFSIIVLKIHIMYGDVGGFGDLGGFGVVGMGMVLNTDRSSPPSLGVNLIMGCLQDIIGTKTKTFTRYFGRSL